MKRLIPILLIFCGLQTSCEEIDCTLNNIVLCHLSFYSSSTNKPIAIQDTLIVKAHGTDSILFNRGLNTSKLSLPMSYWKDADTLDFIIKTTTDMYHSQLVIKKTNIPHFESPDCPTTMFHGITEATTKGNIFDSIAISRAQVNYLQDENIKIFLPTRAQ